MRILKNVLLGFFCLLLVHCSSGSSSSTAALTAEEEVLDDNLTSMSGLVASFADINASLSADLKKSVNGLALSVAGANCSYSLTGVTGMDLTQDGFAGTFGPSVSSLTLAKSHYCAQGGDWTGFSFNKTLAAGISCDGNNTNYFEDGGGVLRVNDGSVELYGTFRFRRNGRVNPYTMTCHYTFRDGDGLDQSACLWDDQIYIWETRQGCEVAELTDEAIDTTDPQETLYLFPTVTTGPANFGGRFSADFACRMTQAADYPDLHCLHGVHAFMTTGADDEIKDMPDNYDVDTDLPVVNAVNNESVASNWADLFDSEIDSALTVAWWSGSDPTGAVFDMNDTGSCNNWTELSGDFALAGAADETNVTWISNSELSCNDEAYIMCLCH